MEAAFGSHLVPKRTLRIMNPEFEDDEGGITEEHEERLRARSR